MNAEFLVLYNVNADCLFYNFYSKLLYIIYINWRSWLWIKKYFELLISTLSIF